MKNPLTLEAFAEWCEARNPQEEYCYNDANNCACAQYFRSLGMRYFPTIGTPAGNFQDAIEHLAFISAPELSDSFDNIGTFGSLATETRKFITERNRHATPAPSPNSRRASVALAPV